MFKFAIRMKNAAQRSAAMHWALEREPAPSFVRVPRANRVEEEPTRTGVHRWTPGCGGCACELCVPGQDSLL